MSLDVYLRRRDANAPPGSGIFVRENGRQREISCDEWDAKFPGLEPVALIGADEPEYIYNSNITHNLGRMAEASGIYYACWRPEEIGVNKASELIPLLEAGLVKLKADPEHFRQFNASNGWGIYEHFVPWVEEYLQACREHPYATVEASR